jgi:signal transduction histidine kinase
MSYHRDGRGAPRFVVGSFVYVRWALLLVCLVGLAGVARTQVVDARVIDAMNAPAPEVLIINSYAPGYRWSDDMFTGLMTALRREFKDIEPVVLYLDARRFPEAEREAWQLADVLHKVARRPPRLVITLDNAAFDFALHHRAAIAPGVPLVFGGLNRFAPEMIAGQEEITGVSEETDFSGTFRLIAALRPEARRVLVLSNQSPSAIESRRVFETIAPRYSDRYSFDYYDTWANDQLFERLASLGDEWVALVLDVTRDATGQDNYNNTPFYHAMSTRPRVPVFINSRPPGVRDTKDEPWDAVGGGLIVADMHGDEVGRIAVRVLRGEPARSIPVVEYSPQRLEVEYVQLKRFGIPLDRVPTDALVNNAPASTVAVDRERVIQVVVALIVLTVIVLVLSLNILARHRAERALRTAEEHLRASQKLEAVGLLAGGVAHDFNNILQVIRGHAGFLREALAAPAQKQELEDVMVIEDAAERATRLTRQLLAFSRKQALNFGPVDPNALVNEMVAMLRRLLGEHIELQVSSTVEPCPIVADRSQLEQVILNLCLNARDAMPSGGRIRIELKCVQVDPADLSELSELKSGPHLAMSISDTGAGMSQEVRRRIFEPFFTTKATGKGTGLGLAVVYGVVRQHGGAIRVYSEEGKGSVFRVMLPIRETSEVVDQAVEGKVLPRGGGTVLLAEDDMQVRKIAERVLSGNGFRVLTAADGQEALDLMATHSGEIRLAVLDVIMPRVSGRQVYDKLRTRYPEVRVLFCSGYSADMLSPEFAPGEGFAVLNKPYTSRELLAQVHRLLAG